MGLATLAVNRFMAKKPSEFPAFFSCESSRKFAPREKKQSRINGYDFLLGKRKKRLSSACKTGDFLASRPAAFCV